jgi:hypothetical protein
VVVHPPEVVVVEGRDRPVQGQDLEAVLRELELADDLRTEQRDDVREDAEAVPGHDLLGDRGTTQHVPALEDDDLLAGLRQVRRRYEAVVASADHDRVVALRHRSSPSSLVFGPGSSKKAIRTPVGARSPMLALGS